MSVASESILPEYLQDLNPPQREAVCHFEGPILVLAGAGSGKTRVLTRRVAHLVLARGVHPQNILAVTFTNKATDEMRERLSGLLGSRAGELWVATFHSSALRMLRRHAQKLGYSNDFVVYDDQDSRGLIKDILKECQVNEKRFPLQSFIRAIDSAKNAFVAPEEYYRWAKSEFGFRGPQAEFEMQLRAEVYDKYQQALRRANAMDFGDLLMQAVILLQQHKDVLSWYQRALHFVLVDEFQDTNKVQYEFVKLITETRKNLLVVGDDDQSIYAFRGATVRNILEFEKDFPETRVVLLEQNYRSTGTILDAAWNVIRHNPTRRQKKLWTAADAGAPIGIYVGTDEMDEARFVVDRIQHERSKGRRFSDVAIFYRTNAQSRAIEETLVNNSIPYRIYGGLKFYERKEIKDILAYLRILVNPADDAAFIRTVNTPPRGIGAQAVQAVVDVSKKEVIPLLAAAEQVAEKNKHLRRYLDLIANFREAARTRYLSTLIAQVVKESEYGPRLEAMKDPTAESRIENLKELEAIGRSMESASDDHLEVLKLFLDRVSLTTSDEVVAEVESGGPEQKSSGSVSLMTLHLAKGLEFPVAFLTGMEEGLLPHYRSIFNQAEVEEERRLCYVGITRAKDRLYISRAFSRGLFSSGGGEGFGLGGSYREMSRFLYDIPEELLDPQV